MAWLLRAGVFLIAAALGLGWALRVLAQRTRGPVSGFGSVAELARVERPGWLAWAIGALVLLGAAVLIRRPSLVRGGAPVAMVGVAAGSAFLAAASPYGHFAAIVAIASYLAFTLGLLLRGREASGEVSPGRERAIAGALWLLVTAIAALFALHRYHAFGSGSWDMGCMIHNFYRASRFLSSISTVLGGVDFLGDHFMVGIYLYAPVFWIHASGSTLILIQSANLAAVAPAVYLIARGRGAARGPAIALALAAGLSFGNQSAAYFDSHEICVGFGFLAFGVWALEARRLALATLLLATFALFKESLGAYVLAIGLLAIWRGVRDRDARLSRYGAAWVVGGAIWFVLVNRVFMPALIARGNAPEAHETFADFGPTIFSALVAILKDPLRALGALFVPQEKVMSQLVTLGGVGYLALASPEILIAALPLIAERFLSSKHTMWEMGYHYAAPLCFYAAWATAIGWPRIVGVTRALLGWLGGPRESSAAVLTVYLAASTALIATSGYRHPANFLAWNMEYFSTPERRAVNRRAIALLLAQGRDAKIAAQNRLLPQLAARPHIYRLGDWSKTDWVLLSVGENAWPWDDGYPKRLAGELGRDPAWRLVFAEGDAKIFARVGVTDLPAIAPEAAPGFGVDGGSERQ